MIVEYSTFHYL